MSIVADFSLPRSDLLLGAVPTDWSGRVEFETCVPVASGPLPFVAVTGDTAAFADSARADPAVASLTQLDSTASWTRFRLAWTDDAGREIRRHLGDAVVLEAAAVRDWNFSLRFAEFDDVTRFRERVEESGVSLELHRLCEESASNGRATDLTELQRMTLSLALRHGYFEVPRSATLSDLSEELGVSKQAVSERLRRAVALLAADAAEGFDAGR